MTLEHQIKTGLDETRLLILGATILLGFQFQSVFQEGFRDLPELARELNVLALLMMVTTIALLVTPPITHRIGLQGRATPKFRAITTWMAGLALGPFALSLGLDIFIVMERLHGTPVAIAAGCVFTLLALWFWYGFEMMRRLRAQQTPEKAPMPRSDPQEREPSLSTRIDQLMTDARVMLPGAQALLGFQLVIALTKTFMEVPPASKLVHTIALACIALATILLMGPAAYHRLVREGEDTEDVYRVGNVFVTSASVPLALGIVGDIYVAVEHMIGSPHLALGAAGGMLVIILGLWFALPMMVRAQLAGKRG